MSNQSLSDVAPSVNIEGVAPNTYVCNGTTYYGDNIASVTSQAIAEQSKPLGQADWYACECGKVNDIGAICTECLPDVDFAEQDYQLYQMDWLVINGRDWLPNESQMEQYLADELIADDTIDIDDFMLAGLPETSYRTPRTPLAEYGVMA